MDSTSGTKRCLSAKASTYAVQASWSGTKALWRKRQREFEHAQEVALGIRRTAALTAKRIAQRFVAGAEHEHHAGRLQGHA